MVANPLLAQKKSKQLIGLGIKGGLNFANVTNAKAINGSNRTGFVVGAFLAPPSKSIISSRTELLFSRQGYDWKTATNTGSVNLNYLVLPQLMGINITKYVQLQIGAQMAYLLNAKADSSGTSTGNPQVDKMMDMYNRFDYGAAGGIEIYPIQNLLIGQKLSEYHTGYRAFSADVLRNIRFVSNSDNFIFDNEMLSQIFMKGYEIAEITCPTLYSKETSSINFSKSVTYGLGVLRVSVVHVLHRWRIVKSKIYS